MALHKTVGLVLRRHNFGEADRIISFLTPDRGKVRAVARGVRKLKSRQAGHLELFCESEVMFAQGRGLDIVAGARLKQHWPELTGDYVRTTVAYLVAEMIDKLVGEETAAPTLYQLTIEAFQDLASGMDVNLAELSFKLKLLDGLGYRPGLTACAVCGRTASANWFLDPALGGLACAACRRGGHEMDVAMIALWRSLLGSDARSNIAAAEGLASRSLPAADAFYDYVFGRRFRSKQLFNGVADGRQA